MNKQCIGIMAAFCLLLLGVAIAPAATVNNTNQLWQGTMVIDPANRLDYRDVSGSYTWTLNEDALGNPANVTYGNVLNAEGQCNVSYYTEPAPITVTLTIQTTEGAPGVLNYVGDLNWSIRLGHLEDTGIINIENGNTLMVNKLYKYANIDPDLITPISYAVVNINNGHLFSYGTPGDRVMSGVTVNIAVGSSLRLMGDIATVNNQAAYTAHTIGARDGLGGVVNAQPGAMLEFTDGGNYLGNPTVLITGVPGGPAIDPATPADTILNAGETAVFTVSAINPITGDTTGLDYNWYEYVDGVSDILVGTNSPTFSIPSIDVSYDGKRYYCKVINALSATDSRQAYLTVKRKVAHWQFEDNMVDIVAGWTGEYVDPNVLHPTPTAVYDPAGIDGKAFQFPGDGTQIRIINSNDGSFDFYPYGLTVSCWLKTSEPQTETYTYPVLYGNPSGLSGDEDIRGWYLWAKSDDTCGGKVVEFSASITTPPLIGDGEWHMLTLTHVGDVMNIYADGAWAASLTNTTPDYPMGDSLVVMGALLNGVRSYKGSLDDVQIYNYPLDGYQVATLYTNFKPGATVCVEPVANDLNDDCIVNLADFAIFAASWLDCNEVPTCTTSNP